MRLSEVKKHLETINELQFMLPDGTFVPQHFHVTEIGQINKRFIDCGGVLRDETVISFQLWNANDIDHRLQAKKLRDIISLSEKKLNLEDAEIEVEYQLSTIGKFILSFEGKHFILLNKQTTCLAQDNCGIPVQKPNKNLNELTTASKCCDPGTSCC